MDAISERLLAAVLAARARNDLSRRTFLETHGFDHDVEQDRMRDEEESGANEIFGTQEPFSTPNQNGGMASGTMNSKDPRQAGKTGGRPTGAATGGGS